jgi:hypothetical protein
MTFVRYTAHALDATKVSSTSISVEVVMISGKPSLATAESRGPPDLDHDSYRPPPARCHLSSSAIAVCGSNCVACSSVIRLIPCDRPQRGSSRPATWPSNTPARQKITDANIYAAAGSHSPACIRFKDSRLKEENVVYPPHIPTMTKIRILLGTRNGPSGPVRALKIPMTKQPVIFTISVPHGKAVPIQFATTPDRA